jgi:hypothetical protein
MGTIHATLLSDVPNTKRVNATLFMGDQGQPSQTRHPGGECPFFLQSAASFLLPGGVLSLPSLKRLGVTR